MGSTPDNPPHRSYSSPYKYSPQSSSRLTERLPLCEAPLNLTRHPHSNALATPLAPRLRHPKMQPLIDCRLMLAAFSTLDVADWCCCPQSANHPADCSTRSPAVASALRQLLL